MTRKDQHIQLSGWRLKWIDWILLLAGLSITGCLAYSSMSLEESNVRDNFRSICKQTQLNIDARLHAYEQLLKGGAALFEVSDRVDRQQWRDYIRRLTQGDTFKGIEGFGFALLIPSAQLPAHIEQVRREGFPDYTVWPSGTRDIYTSSLYIEPFEGGNLRALGYDMWSEPAYRAAMEKARDENSATLTGRSALATKPELLMYVPAYRHGMPVDTVEQRRAALLGWVYSSLRIKDLMRGISDIANQNVIRIKIFDGYSATPSELLYDSAEGNGSYSDTLPSDSLVWRSQAGGRPWTLQFVWSASYLGIDYGKTWLVAGCGAIISLLFFFLIRSCRNNCRDASLIADNSNAIAELRQKETRYRTVMERSSNAILLVDPETLAIDEANPRFFQVFGYSHKHRAQLLLTDIIPLTESEIQANLQRLIEGEDNGWEEQVFRARTGALLNTEVSKSLVQVGPQKKVMFIVQDNSRTRSVEAECAYMERQLRQAHKMVELGQLTGGIIHDINNILAVILGYSNLALTRGDADKENIAQYLKEITHAGERARDLVARILSYSRNQADIAVELAPAPLVIDAIKMLASTIPSRIKLQGHIAPDVPKIGISAEELHQIVMNLIINARDAIADQGQVDIYLNTHRRTPMSCISCTIARSNAVCRGDVSGEYVSLSVSDNGCGIKKKDLKSIFDRSFTTKEVGNGTGFGLSVIQNIVRNADGCVLVDSQIGIGTTIQVVLPVVDTSVVNLPADTTVVSTCSGGNGARILVVDDEPALANYLAEMLECENYEVDVYSDSVKALNYFYANPQAVDAVITDQTMPNKSGLEIAGDMLALRPDLPVILCCGYSDTVDEAIALSFGIRRFFYKPVSAKELIIALEKEIACLAEKRS